MSANKVTRLLTLFTLCLLGLSLLQYRYGWRNHALSRINLLSSMIKLKAPKPHVTVKRRKVVAPSISKTAVDTANTKFTFKDHTRPKTIMHFGQAYGQPSLKRTASKLYQLSQGKKAKLRIAYLGDSMIEADLITSTFRSLLQAAFGGSGVGFVPIKAVGASSRTTVTQSSSGWEEQNFKSLRGRSKPVYLSGRAFYTPDGSFAMTDHTLRAGHAPVDKFLLCGSGSAQVVVGEHLQEIHTTSPFNRIRLDSSLRNQFALTISGSGDLPVFGVSFETASGVVVDNYSFRGISGSELATIDGATLDAVAQEGDYDLIILQYGVNELFSPELDRFGWYAKVLRPAVKRLQKSFPGADFLLISAGDRAFRYEGEYRSAVGLEALVATQARVAQRMNCSFYNLYQTMGGNGTIIKWVNTSPPLATRDYVHPNAAGAAILGRYLFDAVKKDYEKLTHKKG